MPERTLIVGGARSGKSRLAENLVAAAPLVDYVAPGYLPGDDAEWAARVAAHQARRPATWRTIETTDVAGVLAGADEHAVILIDCLATWLTRVLDAAGGGIRLRQEEFTPERLAHEITTLASAPQKLLSMGQAARSQGAIDAAERLADLVMKTMRR